MKKQPVIFLLAALSLFAVVACTSKSKVKTRPDNGLHAEDTIRAHDTHVRDTGRQIKDAGRDRIRDVREVAGDAVDATNDAPPAFEITRFHGCNGPVDLKSVPVRNFIIAPYLILPKTNGITIQWEAMDDGPAYLLWGKKGHLTDCTCAPKPRRIPIDSTDVTTPDDGWLYSVTLTGLQPYTTYDYTLANARVPKANPKNSISRDAEWVAFGMAHFTTAPLPGKPFNLVVYGDNQPFALELKPVIDQIMKTDVDLVLHVGDIVHDGTIEEFRYDYFMAASPFTRNVPHLYIAGNHEGHGLKLPFDSFFPVPNRKPVMVDGEQVSPGPRTGYFDYGNVRFFLLDSERDMGEGSDQLKWLNAMLEETVKKHPEITWIFASWHRPTFTEAGRVFIGPREALHKVMKHWKVDVVWNGHNHLYEHFLQDGVVYIVTGGGGALLNLDVNGGTTYPEDNRIAAEGVYHFVHGTIGKTKAVFQAIRAADSKKGKAGTVIDTFTIYAKDRSSLR